MSKCNRIRRLIGVYLYEDLSEVERGQVELHLQECEACREEAQAVHSLVQRISSDLVAMPAGAEQRVLAGVARRAARETSEPRHGRPMWGALRLALTAAAMLALGIWIGRTLPHQVQTNRTAPTREPRISTSQTAAPAENRVQAASGAVAPQARPQPARPPRRLEAKPVRKSQTRVRPHRAPTVRSGPVAEAPKLALRALRPQGVDDIRLAQAIEMETAP